MVGEALGRRRGVKLGTRNSEWQKGEILFGEKVGIQAGLADDGFQGSGFHLLVQRHRYGAGHSAISLPLHPRMTSAGADAAESALARIAQTSFPGKTPSLGISDFQAADFHPGR